MPLSLISAIPRFDPDDIRRAVAAGKKSGLIRMAVSPSTPCPSPAPDTPAELAQPGEAVPTAGPMRTVWVDVTPAIAAEWIKNNFVNRPLREDVVQAYARDMRNGVWVPTHQGIAFSDSNALIDGQHRLSAIVLSGLTRRMMITYGLPAKIEGSEMTTMDAVDRGRARSVADQLKIQHGLANGTAIAAITASIGALCYGERTRRLSVAQTLEIYRAFESPINYTVEHRSREHGLRAAGVLAAFAFAIAVTDHTPFPDLRLSYDALISGDSLVKGSPLALLRAFLTSPDARLLTRGTDRGVAELTLRALQLELEGKRVDLLTMSPEGTEFFRLRQTDRVKKISGLFCLTK